MLVAVWSSCLSASQPIKEHGIWLISHFEEQLVIVNSVWVCVYNRLTLTELSEPTRRIIISKASIIFTHCYIKGGKYHSSGNIEIQQSKWILLVLHHRCQNQNYSKTSEALFAKKICKSSCSSNSHQKSAAQAKTKNKSSPTVAKYKLCLSRKTNPHSGTLAP